MEEENEIKETIGNYIIFKNKIKDRGLLNDYFALNQKYQEKIICKILRKTKLKEKGIRENEMKDSILIHSKIEHNNVVKLIEFHENSDNFYIFHEYIEGKTLSKLIQINQKAFEQSEIFIIINQIMDLLIILYDNNIILKDLSLRNIFVKEKNNQNEKTQVLLCNLENKNIFSFKNITKKEIEENYNNIVFKLGIIICKLIDFDFYLFLKEININEENMKIINYIENNIIKNLEIAENIKELIIKMILLGRNERIHLKKIKNLKWFTLNGKTNIKNIKNIKNKNENNNEEKNIKEKNIKENNIKDKNIKEKNIREKNDEPPTDKSFSSNVSSIGENKIKNNNKKSTIIEETIYTDEGYLELYKKEKELLLGIIDYFDKDELIKSINISKAYSINNNNENNNENNNNNNDKNNDNVNTERNNHERQRTNHSADRRKNKYSNNKVKSSLFKCY